MRHLVQSIVSVILLLICLVPAYGQREPDPAKPGRDATPRSASDFIRTRFVHGLPYQEARQIQPNEIPLLLHVLSDRREEAYWTNAVGTLGAIGDVRAVSPLIGFLEAEDHGILSPEHYRAKASVLIALGYLVHASQDEQALTYLIDSADMKVWDTRNLQWISPFYPTLESRNLQMVKKAILGLGLTGHPKALEVLETFRKKPRSEHDRRLQAEVRSVLNEALKAHSIVQEVGLMGYYR